MSKTLLITDGEYKWDVEFCDTPSALDFDAEGTCEKPADDEVGHIRVRGFMPPFRVRQTLMHELLHGCEYAEGVEIDHKTLDIIARYITRVLLLNPKLAEFYLPKPRLRRKPKKKG